MSFRQKILLFSVLPVAVIMLAATVIVIGQVRARMLEAAQERIRVELRTAAEVIEEGNQETIAIAKAMAASQVAGLFGRRDESLALARAVLEDNQQLIGAYFGYEPDADSADRSWVRRVGADHGSTVDSGRFLPYWFRAPNAGGSLTLEPLVEMESSLYYQGVKDKFLAGAEEDFIITEPYLYNNQNLIIEQTVPIVIDGKFVGIAGVDRGLDFLDAFLEDLKPFESARLLLVSGRGRLIAATIDDASEVDLRTMAVENLYVNEDGAVPIELFGREDGQYVLDRDRATPERLATLSSGLRDRVRTLMEDADGRTVSSYRAEWDGVFRLAAAARIPTGDWTLLLTVERDEIMGGYRETLYMVSAVALIGFLVSVSMIVVLVTRISRRIANAAGVARCVADGDLTIEAPVESNDESGRLQGSIQDMIAGLASLTGRIRQATHDLSGIATELFVGARQQEGSVAEFSASTNEITAAAKQINATSEELANVMSDVNGLAKQTGSLASLGQQSLSGTDMAMGRLQASAEAIRKRLHEIEETTAGIGVAVTTINKVADRTNMLSLNASIEAEKAGEERTGFAVVAREVRRLADQTASATVDISGIVQELQRAVRDGVTEMDSFTEEVSQGAANVLRIGSQLQGIIERVQLLTGKFEQVNQGVQLQSGGASQITAALEGLAAGVEQTEKTLAEFKHASEHLQSAVSELREEVSGIRCAEQGPDGEACS